MKYLLIVALLMILASFFYELAYYKRRKLMFDGKCNDFFIKSRALGISGITLLILSSILIAFNI